VKAERVGIVIASEAKQSIAQRGGELDCFVALLLAMTVNLAMRLNPDYLPIFIRR
jgi:hypothetical protein